MNINSLGMARPLSLSEAARLRQAAGGSSFAQTLEAKLDQPVTGKADSRGIAVMGAGSVQSLEQGMVSEDPSAVLSQEEKNFFDLYTARKYLNESEMQFFNSAMSGGKSMLRGGGYSQICAQSAQGGLSLQA
ncbi:MAG TPA: hypothetical protein H9784_06805 [Candidatus Desulfovibrio intestinavium]|uniref:Uncharacterized protein n=1 Tax=Candidatus Desulfovibrio intestinavium TaxID=2838534 RepID=A0A9D2KQR4_9BACT|nr:hypothetical protein [Candidatus Desulfovibrio intestinavium]